jgi:hypothetical protein
LIVTLEPRTTSFGTRRASKVNPDTELTNKLLLWFSLRVKDTAEILLEVSNLSLDNSLDIDTALVAPLINKPLLVIDLANTAEVRAEELNVLLIILPEPKTTVELPFTESCLALVTLRVAENVEAVFEPRILVLLTALVNVAVEVATELS